MTAIMLTMGISLIFFSGLNMERWLGLGERKHIVKSIFEGVAGLYFLLATIGSVL